METSLSSHGTSTTANVPVSDPYALDVPAGDELTVVTTTPPVPVEDEIEEYAPPVDDDDEADAFEMAEALPIELADADDLTEDGYIEPELDDECVVPALVVTLVEEWTEFVGE